MSNEITVQRLVEALKKGQDDGMAGGGDCHISEEAEGIYCLDGWFNLSKIVAHLNDSTPFLYQCSECGETQRRSVQTNWLCPKLTCGVKYLVELAEKPRADAAYPLAVDDFVWDEGKPDTRPDCTCGTPYDVRNCKLPQNGCKQPT